MGECARSLLHVSEHCIRRIQAGKKLSARRKPQVLPPYALMCDKLRPKVT